jgi:hypothetical protein
VTFANFTSPVTIDASNLLFICQREDPVHQLALELRN